MTSQLETWVRDRLDSAPRMIQSEKESKTYRTLAWSAGRMDLLHDLTLFLGLPQELQQRAQEIAEDAWKAALGGAT